MKRKTLQVKEVDEGKRRASLHTTIMERRLQAQQRQSAHNALSLQEKIAKAESRPGNSARELKRLRAQLANVHAQ